MAVYGIIGGGTCPKNIIEDGLRELGIEGNTFVVVGTRKPSPNEERVYDFLIENEATYEVATFPDAVSPRILVENAAGTVELGQLLPDFLDMLVDNDGVLLLLWDESNEQLMSDIATTAYDNKLIVKELSNGLTPIAVQDAPTPFSKEEIASMPLAVQKRNTTSAGDAEVHVQYALSQERSSYQAPEGDCVVNVVFPNGTVVTTSATTEEVRNLLGLG